MSGNDYVLAGEGPDVPPTPTRAEADARLTELIAKWRNDVSGYPSSPVGRYASIAVRLCAQELEQVLTALYGPPVETPTPAETDHETTKGAKDR